MKWLLSYLANLSRGRLILWCYLIWYLVVLVRYFDSNPRIWLTSIGLSGIIGVALYISSTTGGNKLERWQIIRLFLMPFFVSSFAALVKGKDFVLIFSPNVKEILIAIALCAAFLCGGVDGEETRQGVNEMVGWFATELCCHLWQFTILPDCTESVSGQRWRVTKETNYEHDGTSSFRYDGAENEFMAA